jgi:geranylgeranyl pyrophosphate synthase
LVSTALELELSAIASRPAAALRPAVKHALQGGKRARGLLLMAAAAQLDMPAELPAQAAACVELLHAATLVQDDIFDAGCVRRGRPSVVCAFGSQLATLAADWMLAEAMRIAYGLGLGFGESLAACAQAMMTAEAREYSARAMRDGANLRERAMSIARGKTGALFGLALHGGHMLAGETAQAAQLYRCGLDLGVAFQYLDDALDLYGDEQAAGKDLAKDLGTGLYTMAVLDALPLLPPSVAEAMLQPGSILPEDVLRALQMPAVRESVLHCAHTRWQQAADACGQALPVTSTVPHLLQGLCSAMLDHALHERRVKLPDQSAA